MFHYPVFVARRRRCVLQTVAGCCTTPSSPVLCQPCVAPSSQTVANRCRCVSNQCFRAHPFADGMDDPEQDETPTTGLDHLEALPKRLPPSKTGKVLWAWPKILDALRHGWTLSAIWEALRDDGIDMPYNQFRVYVSRIRKRTTTPRADGPGSLPPPGQAGLQLERESTSAVPPAETDPYSAIRKQRRLKQRSGFEFDPFSTDKDLLE
jgi:hypothetical protein